MRPTFSIVFTFGFAIESIKELEGALAKLKCNENLALVIQAT
jgi:hypothetical protein